MSLLSVLLLGFVLGLRHATDPDHVVAVGTIVVRSPGLKPAALVGAFWGLGHSLTVVGVGILLVLFKVVIPPHLGLALELVVALMLVVLGVVNLGARPHSHGRLVPEPTPFGAGSAARSVLVGLVHGLAGSAAVALLAVGAIRDARWAAAYLAIFGAGTLAGMMLMTSAMAVPLSAGAKRLGDRLPVLGSAMGIVSVGLGLALAYQVGFVDGLFSLHPSWTPH